ncbi:MAG: prolyl oligopeptidase family serine peptidase [Holophagales bacterium]|jgi:dipeptidyl aminopeptidase/acylaminoacyl peptidase|nr:prolyl oligopeptidase family serine peptidase [Holophagales bacterium]
MAGHWLVFGLATCLAGLPGVQQTKSAPVKPIRAEELTVENVFRTRPYAGQQARGAAFSCQGRYLAYLWNPFGENGTDLYVYDAQTGQARRVTSIETMKTFDAPEAIERFQKKAEERERLFEESQARAEAQAAYLAGANIDLDQWDMAAIELLKKEAAEKKARTEAESERKKAESEKKETEGTKRAEGADITDEGDAKNADDYAKKADGSAKKDSEKEKELWEWRDELKKKREKENIKPGDLYPGVSSFKWANKADELIFVYRGDLFRYVVETDKTDRLTNTDREERVVGYTSGDDGFFFQDGTSIFRVDFNSGRLLQLNRAFVFGDDAEKKYSVQGADLSQDGRWMAIYAQFQEDDESGAMGRGQGQRGQGGQGNQGGRQVQIMDYTKRFAESRQVRREVSDDKRRLPATAIYIRSVDEAPTRQPEPIFTNDGGDVWFERTPVSWSKDGSNYAFATWEREKETLKIYLGEASETEAPEVVLERVGDVGHEVFNSLAPRFTPNGKTLVVALDETGFRQPWAMDVATKSIRPILSGDFEAHTILGFTPDSNHVFLLANKDSAAMNVFRADLASGAMELIGKQGDYHRNPAISENGEKAAMNSGNWLKRNELHVVDIASKDIKVITDSHDPAWPQINLLQPERFNFTNRHGDKIQCYMFKPKGWKTSDKRPSIVYIYGGPLGNRNSVEVDSFQPTGYLFGMYMAAKHGYVTITIDTRGQSNYGRRFSGANWEQPGLPQTEDLEDLMKHIQRGFGIDTRRVGLTGWSFGGFQTQYTMYSKPDLFACGIAGAGPTEWENYNSWYSGRTIGKVDRAKPVLRKYSLLPMAKNLRKPLLLVHGMADPNVLYQDTVNVYRALLESGKESIVDLFLDPDGEHGMGGAVKPKGWHKKYEAFFLWRLGRG